MELIKESKYKTTTAFQKIVGLTKPVKIVQGGKGSSKTISILMYFILLAISKRENLILSIVAESLPNLKSGAMRDFEKILKSWGLYDKFQINKTDRTYTFGSNMIEFFSVDGEHSRLGSRRTHLYINEADAIKFSTYLELYSRTSVFTILDYNPRRKFWVHKNLKGEPHVDFIILNYLDNEYIPQNELDSILWFKKKAEEGSTYFKNKWRVLGLGLLGIPEGVVFENWEEKATVPSSATYLGGCLDWGFTNDPTTVTKLYRYDGKIFVKSYLYKRGMINSQIASAIKQDKELMNGVIIADSAEPKSIKELRSYGIRIVKAKDKAILSGINIMQEFEYCLVGKEAVEEWTNYVYKQDRTGEFLDLPVDDWNHIIDPVRYFTVDTLSNSSKGSGSYEFL